MAKRKSMLERNHDPVKDGLARRTKPGERPKKGSSKDEALDRQIHLFITESMYQELRKEAFDKETGYASIVREALETHLS